MFFPQDRRYHKYHINDHIIYSFKRWQFSNSLCDSERRTDEYHGLSSIPEYDIICNWGRDRDFLHPDLKKLLYGKESQGRK